MGKKKGKSTSKGQTLSLADFNPEAFAQETLVPTHSSGSSGPREFGQTNDQDKDWSRAAPGEEPRPKREPARGDVDNDWRSSVPEHRDIPSARESGPTDDSNWRGTQRGLGDEDSNWRGSANVVSREEQEAARVADSRPSAGANRGQADGDVDWRGSAGPVVRPDEAPAPQRESAGAVKGRAASVTDWRGSAAPVARSEETAPAEDETTWRGTTRGAGSRADWSRDSCAPVARPALKLAPRSAPVQNDAPAREVGSAPVNDVPARDFGSWRESGGPTSRVDAAPTRFRVPMGPRACMFFARGQCQRGDACRFSHDPEVINAFKAEQEENRKKQLEQTSAPSSPVGTPNKSDGEVNAISAKQEANPEPAATEKQTDDDGFEIVSKPKKAASSQQRRGARLPTAGRA